MGISRRDFGLAAAAALLAPRPARAAATERPIDLILAPTNLGLRPENGAQPGTWQAPRVLMEAGLREALNAHEVLRLPRPLYEFEAQPRTRIRNGRTIRAFSFTLAEHVKDRLAAARFPVIVGGDCSVLLGGLYGLRLAGGRGLVHVDGHSDFVQEQSYATPETLGSAAGMDLALASGRVEPLLADWPDVGVLAADADIVQVGERERDDPQFAHFYGDLLETEITQIPIQEAKAAGIGATAQKVIARLEARGLDRAWLHVDLDVLDERVMGAVDSPGRPGFDYGELAGLVRALIASGRIAGANFAIYDPERDPGHRHAPGIVECIAAGLKAPGVD
jgi:arginase